MPPPLRDIAAVVKLTDEALAQPVRIGDSPNSRRDVLYGLLRREQAILTSGQPVRSEVSRILDLVQAAYGDLVSVMIGRDDGLLDSLRDADWSLRDVLRHAIAVELRYAAQIEYSAIRAESDPVEVKPDLLPCDRLSPPEPEFALSRDGGVVDLLELLGRARAKSDARLVNVSDSALPRPSVWGTVRIDVRMRLHQMAVHLSESAIQIEKIIGAAGEARGIVRRCCIARGLHERWSPPRERAPLDETYAAVV